MRWDDARLVIKTTRSPQTPDRSGPRSEHGEVWALDPNGRLLITISDRESASAATVNLEYKRRQAVWPAPRERTLGHEIMGQVIGCASHSENRFGALVIGS